MHLNQVNLINFFYIYFFKFKKNIYVLSNVDSVEEMKAFLSMQQKAINCLIETVNKDVDTLKNIKEKMTEFVN